MCGASDLISTNELEDALSTVITNRECLPTPSVQPNKKEKKEKKEDEDEDENIDEEGNGKGGKRTANMLDSNAPPLSDIHAIFHDIAKVAIGKEFDAACIPFMEDGIRIFTMCSGTESPIISMDLLQNSLQLENANNFKYRHLGSAEIEPPKQAFIQRNFSPPVIFRDVTEFVAHAEDLHNKEKTPFTAYGAHADPPKGVHILIAGSSCVDFSGLNSNQKQFDATGQQGESSATFSGVYAYAQAYRPNLILMENVISAPWDQMSNHWRAIDYYCKVVKLDTINYYLPQTRARSYCLIMDMNHADEIDFDYEKAGDDWALIMASFQRCASSSYSEFMLRESDPRLLLEKNRIIETTSGPPSQEWAKCRKRHRDIRLELQLGELTPYTNLRGNAQCKMSDAAWQEWSVGQSQRVLDALDINYLRYVSQRDFDMAYKHRNINSSQNVDRDLDTRQWGIVGCVTPKGNLFETHRGGPLIGLEVFALQGMPIGDLNLNKESSKLLQDLAGNAMSTTVIGSAIISIIIACHTQKKKSSTQTSIFQEYATQFQHNVAGSPISRRSGPKLRTINDFDELIESNQGYRIESGPTIEVVQKAAARSAPLCRCEGLDRHSEVDFVLCPKCFYTCCTACSRQQHDGLECLRLDPATPRSLARDFIQLVTSALPPALALETLGSDLEEHFSKGHPLHMMLERIISATTNTIRFKEIKHDPSWRVIYESDSAELELDFVPQYLHGKDLVSHMDATWFLFAKPAASAPSRSKSRSLLRHPIARMKPAGNLLSGVWQFWQGPTECMVRMRGTGDEIPSWEKGLGLEEHPFLNLSVFTELQTTVLPLEYYSMTNKIVGKYKLLQSCPAASGTLHKTCPDSSAGRNPVFLFLDSNPLKDACHDRLVFSSQPPRGNTLDDRAILAKLPASWRPVVGKDRRGQDLAAGVDIVCEHLDRWSSFPDTRLCVPEDALVKRRYQPDIATDVEASCADSSLTVLLLELALDSRHQQRWRPGHAISVELQDKPEALKDFGWILPYATKIAHLEAGWLEIANEAAVKCATCLPPLPESKWVFAVSGQKGVVKATEDAQQAAAFEQALKERPRCATAIVHCHGQSALLEIKFNLKTMAHRARTLLYLKSNLQDKLSTAEWRLCRHHHFTTKALFICPIIASNTGETPIQLSQVGSRALWQSQRRILGWMLKQERNPQTWREMALVESCLPSLGWRVDARAFLERTLRGGIIADSVGAGKTTTSLALVNIDYRDMISGATFATSCAAGHIKSNATLVLLPKNIIKQWVSELKDCLAWKEQKPRHRAVSSPCYLEIGTTKDLLKFTRTEIQSATIILAPFDIFQEELYWNKLQKLACAPNVPSEPGRALHEWMNQAMSGLESVVTGLGVNKNHAWANWEELRSLTNEYGRFAGYKTRASNRAKAAKESKKAGNVDEEEGEETDRTRADGMPPAPKLVRGRKRARQEAEESSDTAADVTKEPSDEEIFAQELQGFRKDGEIPNLFHMFSFRRIIVDEFTYVHGKTLLALFRLEASSKWLLSGTPPIHSYDNINTMSKLLGTRISTYNEEDGKFGFGRDASQMTKDRSDAQKFLSHQDLVSVAYKESVYQHATTFSDMFIRKNQADVVLPKAHHHSCPFTLTPSEMHTYMKAEKIVSSPDTSFNQRPAAARPSRTTAATEAKSQKEVPEKQAQNEVLLKEAVSIQSGPDAALVCCTTALNKHFPMGTNEATGREREILGALMTEHEKLIVAKSSELLRLLKEQWYDALNFSNTPAFSAFVQSVKNGTLAAKTIMSIVDHLVWYAKVHPMQGADPEPDKKAQQAIQPAGKKAKLDKTPKVKAVEKQMDLRMGDIEALLVDLEYEFCQVRLLENVLGVVNGGGLSSCIQCGTADSSTTNMEICTNCGQIVACSSCLSPGGASIVECCIYSSPEHNARGSEFVLQMDDNMWEIADKIKGARLRKAISIIQKDFGDSESGLVFVQFPELKDAFVEACEAAGVECFDGFKESKKHVERFCKEAAGLGRSKGKKRRAVLVLKLDSADAAGWNLHCANHVIFLAPLVGASKADRDAVMTQAVGRCLRPRQVQEVHVYQLWAQNTVEEGLVATG